MRYVTALGKVEDSPHGSSYLAATRLFAALGFARLAIVLTIENCWHMTGCACTHVAHRLEHISRVGQDHKYTEYIRCFWQGNHQIYGVYIQFWPTLRIRKGSPSRVPLVPC